MAGKKLLVADDSLTIQKVIRLALSSEGYEIQAVSDGNDALQKIPLFRPDVVLIDVSLPGKSAVEVKRSINEDSDLDEVRFVLMSSAFEKIDEDLITEVKFHGRLTKPFDPAHLRQVLNEVLAAVVVKRTEPTSVLQHPGAPALGAVGTPPPLPFQAQPSAFPSSETPPPLPFSTSGEFSDSSIEAPPFTTFQDSAIPAPPIEPQKDDTHSVVLTGSFSGTAEMQNDLWEPGVQASPETAFHPEFPPPPLPGNREEAMDSDIRHLTESTIKMSGLDDYQWSVNEPSIKPPSPLLETEGATFDMEKEIQVAPPQFNPGKNSDHSAATEARAQRTEMPIDEREVEALVRKQVEAMVEKIAKKIIPDVAEKLIKQEINRLLSERP